MNRRELDEFKSNAADFIFDIIDTLGIDYVERYQYIVAPCPIHNGDSDRAWSWHLDKKVWQCFSRGCHDKFGSDVIGLVRGILKCKFPDAVKFVEEVLGNNSYTGKYSNSKNKSFVKSTKKKDVKIYNEDSISKLKYHNYLELRGYPKELLDEYHVGITDARFKQMSNRLIIPIRDIDGNIVGFTGRTLFSDWKEKKIAKWVHSAGFNKIDNLFNIDRAKQFIEESGVAIIVEGPLDVLRLEQYGIKNSVAIFGRKLHNSQISILFRCMTNKLIVALDGDTAGRSGADDAMSIAKSYFTVKRINLDSGDVGDLSKKEVMEVFNG